MIDCIVRNIRDPEWRVRIVEYLDRSPLYGILTYYKMGYPAPPYSRPAPDDTSMFVYRVPAFVLWGLDR